jgi:hypothetical protein
VTDTHHSRKVSMLLSGRIPWLAHDALPIGVSPPILHRKPIQRWRNHITVEIAIRSTIYRGRPATGGTASKITLK